MEPVKAAVIGLGSMGMNYHAETLHRLEQFDLIAACDGSQARLDEAERRFGCRGYTDFGAMLADPDLELVSVATPSSMHAEHALRALAAGKHSVVEKPFCLNVAEFDAMAAAAREHGRLICCYQNRRWDNDHLTTMKVIEGGALGDLLFIQSLHGGFSRVMLEYGVKEFRPDWRGLKQFGGGVLYDFGPHIIDQILCWAGHRPVAEVFADLRGLYWTEEVDDTALVVIRFADGLTATLVTTTAARTAVTGTAIVGHEGAYREGKLYTGQPDDIAETEVEQVTGSWDSYYLGMHAAIREGAPVPVPLEQTRVLLQVFDACFESSRTHQTVKLA